MRVGVVRDGQWRGDGGVDGAVGTMFQRSVLVLVLLAWYWSAFCFGRFGLFFIVRVCRSSDREHRLCGSQDGTAVTAFPIVCWTARCAIGKTLTEILWYQEGAIVTRVVVGFRADTVLEGLSVGREIAEVWVECNVRSARTRRR